MFRTSSFYIRLTNREFYPFWVMYLPSFIYWAWLGLRARSIFFFSAVNPTIFSGGMMAESKQAIFKLIPPELLPKTKFFPKGTHSSDIIKALKEAAFTYPIIAKPDVGERGLLVTKIDNQTALKDYIEKYQTYIDFIFQEFITHPNEYSVFYYRHPDETNGRICSLTLKKFLSVIGDGKRSIADLLLDSPRAILVLASLRKHQSVFLNTIPLVGEEVLVEPIGNHSRGTMFINGNALIDQQLNETFDQITKRIDGVYLCRYDLKCTSLEDLKAGHNIQIMELNGVGAEPAHIYDNSHSQWRTYRDLLFILYQIYQIATANHRRGVPYLTFREARATFRSHQAYLKMLKRLD